LRLKAAHAKTLSQLFSMPELIQPGGRTVVQLIAVRWPLAQQPQEHFPWRQTAAGRGAMGHRSASTLLSLGD
jgi:hypothetical protein